MLTKKTTQGNGIRLDVLRGVRNALTRAPRRFWLVAAAILCALGATERGMAQTTGSQLTIGRDTSMTSLDDAYSSVVFNGAYALTLSEGQTLRTVLVSKETGAALNLGDKTLEGQEWTIVANNPSWSGTTNVLSGNTLVINGGIANPLGAYSDTALATFGVVNLYDGSTLKLRARAADSSGKPASGETKIGGLSTDSVNDAKSKANAVVEVGENQTLTIMDGIDVSSKTGLTKTGAGTLKILTNGSTVTAVTQNKNTGSTTTQTTKKDSSTSDSSVSEEEYMVTVVDLGKTTVSGGTLSVASGTRKVNDAEIEAASLHIGKGATLDIQQTGEIDLTGDAGDVVFSADDGSKVNIYIDKEGSTSYVAKTYNTYMNLGETTLNVNTSLRGSDLPTSMTVFSTQDVGQTIYTADKISVVDNILGKNYVVDKNNSTAEKLVLKLEKNKTLASKGKTPNERAVGKYLDNAIASNKYNDKEYALLNKLEQNMDSLSFAQATGEIHASTVGFMYMNNFTTTQSLFDMLRNNSLVAYSGGDSSVAPMDYGGGSYNSSQYYGQYPNSGGYYGGASGGAFDNGQLYYNNDTNSYGPGVVPIDNTGAMEYQTFDGGVYNGETYGSGVGGMSGGSYYPPEESGAGNYDFGWRGQQELSTLATMRGQTTYGDPGTLIYSAWFAAIGGSTDTEVHKSAAAYNGKQAGFLTGLDLFCSCDCRFGAYYGYQHNELKNVSAIGKLKTNNHLVGVYHQFGDEMNYNIANIRAGYDHYQTERNLKIVGVSDHLTAKYNGWNLGASFEHGANFAVKPLIFSPYVSADYNFFYRNKFTETSKTGSGYALHAGKSNYHSLRGQVGGRVAVDMYPGEQQIRLVGRAAYVHEFLNPMYGKTTMSFASLPNASGGFDIYGNSLGRDWCMIGAGVDWAPVPALVLFAKGDYLFNKYVRDPWTTLGLKYRW